MHGTVCPRSGLAAAPRRLCACARVQLPRRACCVPALGPCCCAVLPLALGLFCSCAGARLRHGLIQLSELVVELVSTLRCFKTGKVRYANLALTHLVECLEKYTCADKSGSGEPAPEQARGVV